MSRIFVTGMGAVSPAGWNVTDMRDALDRGEPLPVQSLARPGWNRTLSVRQVPNPNPRPEFLAHPRLRRSSPVTHYAAAAALEATAGLRAQAEDKDVRLGIVGCLQSGCVQYTCRFYDETLKNPATASPLVFPETVYGAPTSHVAALLENVVMAYTLVGDSSAYLQGLALASEWLADRRVDACLIIGAEETNWIIPDALRYWDRTAIVAAGAGALCLCRDARLSAGVELAAITDAYPFTSGRSRPTAAKNMREQLGKCAPGELLVDGLGNNPRTDGAEQIAWSDWTGRRVSPKRILGEGMMATAAWQLILACDAVARGQFTAANVSLVGANQQALGARVIAG
jgi:3-oxoacyl-(acyl-carrier-protein) synthase